MHVHHVTSPKQAATDQSSTTLLVWSFLWDISSFRFLLAYAGLANAYTNGFSSFFLAFNRRAGCVLSPVGRGFAIARPASQITMTVTVLMMTVRKRYFHCLGIGILAGPAQTVPCARRVC
uniref:Uncharacterized protein n=1 Tax=Anopheles melas TaxID=34690 RepID=A0A182TKC7_9DIPT